MMDVVITGTGVFHPEHKISNTELVDSFNQYVKQFNAEHSLAIQNGEVEALEFSDAAFIEKASGIKSRYVIDKVGVLDPNIMHPVINERSDSSLSIQAEMATHSARTAMEKANISSLDIDTVIVACSNMQRAYPSIAIEVQAELGIEGGFAFDMNVACSSATFGIQMAESLIKAGQAKTVLLLSPEICSAHLNFRDRDSHFIFGDVTSAMIIQREDVVRSNENYRICSTKTYTQFSNNIRNNACFLNRLTKGANLKQDKLFYQNGRKVFKEVTGKVVEHVLKQLVDLTIKPSDLSRLWLHQANANMNRLICSKIMGIDLNVDEAPIILDEFANTSSAGSIVAFDKYHTDLKSGSKSLLCSFGAGYSIGSVILEKL